MNFRKLVCLYAWAIQQQMGLGFGVSNSYAMKKAWGIYRLKKAMHQGTVEFAFKKVDGTIRYAKGTLKDIDQHIKGTGKQKTNSVPFYDVEKQAFRSFKPESVLV